MTNEYRGNRGDYWDDFIQGDDEFVRLKRKNRVELPNKLHVSCSLSCDLLQRLLHPGFDRNARENYSCRLKAFSLDYFLASIGFDPQINLDPNFALKRIFNEVRTFVPDSTLEKDTRQTLTTGIKHWQRSIRATKNKGSVNLLEGLWNTVKSFQVNENSLKSIGLWGQLNIQAILDHGACLTASTASSFSVSCPEKHYWKEVKGTEAHPIFQLVLNDIVISLSSDWVMITVDGEQYLGTRDIYLMIVDLCCQRMNAMLISYVGEEIKKQGMMTTTEVTYVINYFDELTSRFGSKAYDLIGQHEPMCVATILSSGNDDINDPEKFIKGLRDDYLNFKDADDVPYDCTPFFDTMMRFLEGLRDDSIHKVSECFGLFKIGGNPVVDPKRSITKLLSVTRRWRRSEPLMILKVSCRFRDMFATRYRAHKSHWPKMDVSKLEKHNPIRVAYENNSHLSTHSRLYNILDWSQIRFEKTFDFGRDFDLMKLINDKTLSCDKEQLRNALETTGRLGDPEEKSVLYAWLMRTYTDPEEFLMKISREGFDEKSKAIAVRVKELEIKYSGRLFGMTTFESRMYIVLTEALIKDFFLDFFPEITIMEDEVTMARKMYDLTRSDGMKARSHRNEVIVNMDFEKWNSYMRKGDTWRIFSDIDDLIGIPNCVSRTHELFDNTLFYLSSNYVGHTEKIFEMEKGDIGHMCWQGHYGGVEGLRQTGWTLFTTVTIFEVLSDLNVTFKLMGQGDNQVLILMYDKRVGSARVKEHHAYVLERMFKRISRIGPPLKLSETWSSSKLFAYGKKMIYNGLPLLQPTKRLLKNYSTSDEDIPTIESSLSGIVSNCMAGTSQDIDGVISYFMYSFSTARSWKHHFNRSSMGSPLIKMSSESSKLEYDFLVSERVRDMRSNSTKSILQDVTAKMTWEFRQRLSSGDPELITLLMLFPSILGGYSTYYFPQTIIKKFIDPLTECHFILREYQKTLHRRKDQFLYHHIDNMLKPVHKENCNDQMLAQDPVSVNILKTTGVANSMRTEVVDFLSKEINVENVQFRDFCQLAASDGYPLAEELMKARPIRPFAIYEAYLASPVGFASMGVNQLSRTSTITRMAISRNGRSMVSKLVNAERSMFCSVVYNLNTKNDSVPYFDCSVEWARYLRRESYKKDSDLEGVTVPYPMEYMFISDDHACYDFKDDREKGYIQMFIARCNKYDQIGRAMTLGPCDPLMGGRTTEKYDYKTKEFVISPPSRITILRRLLRFHNWATLDDSGIYSYIREVFKASTDLPIELLTPDIEKTAGGCVDHRFQTPVADRGGRVATLYTTQTFSRVSTDTFDMTTRGGKNTNIFFQPTMIYLNAIMGIAMMNDPMKRSQTCYHAHPVCTCIQEINEDFIHHDRHEWEHLVDRKVDSPFCFIKKEQLHLKTERSDNDYPLLRLKTSFSSKTEENQCKQLANKQVSHEICKKLFMGSKEPGDGKVSFRHIPQVPYNIFFDINYEKLLINMVMMIFSRIFTEVVRKESLRLRKIDIIDKVKHSVRNWDKEAFAPMKCIALMENFLDVTHGPGIGATAPARGMWTESAVCEYLRNIILGLTDRLCRGELKQTNYDLGIIQEGWNLNFHPIFIKLSMMWLDSSDDDEEKELLRAVLNLKTIFSDFLKNDMRITSNIIEVYRCEEMRHLFRVSLDDWTFLTKVVSPMKIWTSETTAEAIIKFYKDVPYDGDLIQHNMDDQDLPDNDYSELRVRTEKLKKRRLMRVETFPSWNKLDRNPIENKVRANQMKDIHSSTGAGNKLLSFTEKIVPYLSDAELVMEFGVGSGQMTKVTFCMGKYFKIFVNDLYDPSSSMDNASALKFPIALAGYPEWRKRIFQMMLSIEGTNDVTSREYGPYIIKNLDSKVVDYMFSDIEGSSKDIHKPFKILRSMFHIGSRKGTKLIVMKFYITGINELTMFLQTAKSYCKDLEIVRSHHSTKGNREFYLFMYGPFREMEYTTIQGSDVFDSIVIDNHLLNGEFLMNEGGYLCELPIKSETAMMYRNFLRSPWAQLSIEMKISSVCPTLVDIMKGFEDSQGNHVSHTLPNEFYKKVSTGLNFVQYSGGLRKGVLSNVFSGQVVKVTQEILGGMVYLRSHDEGWSTSKFKEVLEKSKIFVYECVAGRAQIVASMRDLSKYASHHCPLISSLSSTAYLRIQRLHSFLSSFKEDKPKWNGTMKNDIWTVHLKIEKNKKSNSTFNDLSGKNLDEIDIKQLWGADHGVNQELTRRKYLHQQPFKFERDHWVSIQSLPKDSRLLRLMYPMMSWNKWKKMGVVNEQGVVKVYQFQSRELW